MTNETTPNVIYKDRLFKAIFGRQEHKDWFFCLTFMRHPWLFDTERLFTIELF